MNTHEQQVRSVNERANLAAFSCLLLALGVVVAFFNGWILIIGSHVIRSWIVSCALLLAALVLLWVRANEHRSDGATESGWVWSRAFVTILVVAVIGAGSAMGAFADMWTHNFILDPRGPDGCQVVVRESAFFMGGGAEVYTVGAVGIGQKVGEWSTDDGYRPIEAGSYSLKWDDNGGELTVNGAFSFRPYEQNKASSETLQQSNEFVEVTFSGSSGAGHVDQQPIKCR
ncbi:hypothetical protein [Arthrobacter polaris]|uniref:hypothetical protein n=1 Tax=Arthrobacter polaris TaxID=2813727 RepID=UPI001F447B9E|nr:hypothetical protein [Arthrobacter polaris]UIK87917.1 hypothetical protein J0916_10550 [Arthrobacter polaris]